MSEAMTEAALQAGLRDIRLPAEAAGGLPAEVAAAVALACLAALLAAALVRAVTGRRVRTAEPTLAEEIARLRALPEDRRRVALLHLLKARAPDRVAALRGALYAPGGPSAEAVEAELARHG